MQLGLEPSPSALLEIPLQPGVKDRRHVGGDPLQEFEVPGSVIGGLVGDHPVAQDFPAVNDRDNHGPVNEEMTFWNASRLIGKQTPFFADGSPPEAISPTPRREPQRLVRKGTSLQQLFAHGLLDAVSVFVLIGEDPEVALRDFENHLQHLGIHSLVRGHQQHVGNAIPDVQTLLRLPQSLLDAYPLGDVHAENGQASDLPIGVEDRRDGVVEPSARPGILEMEGPPRAENLFDLALPDLCNLDRHVVVNGGAEHFVDGLPQPLHRRRVHREACSRGIHEDGGFVDSVDDRPHGLLTHPKSPLGLSALGDVHADAPHIALARRILEGKFINQPMARTAIGAHSFLDDFDGLIGSENRVVVLAELLGDLHRPHVKVGLAGPGIEADSHAVFIRLAEIDVAPLIVLYPCRGRAVVHEGAEPVLACPERFLGLSALGDVPDDADQDARVTDGRTPRADLDREDAAVLALMDRREENATGHRLLHLSGGFAARRRRAEVVNGKG